MARRWLTVGLATVASFATTADVSAANVWKSCGTKMPGPFVTTWADDVGCQLARRVGNRYALRDDRQIRGFTCTEPEDVGYEAHRGICRRDGQRVRVEWGV